MSSVALQGNAGGSGAFVLSSPSSNNSRTLTLPDATTTLVGTDATQTLTNKTLTSPTMTTPTIDSAQVPTVSGTAPLYMCRAWVNFNGTGTVSTNQTIRASGNVTSVFKNATGDYTITFTTAMPDANFAVSGTAMVLSARGLLLTLNSSAAPTTTTVRIKTIQPNTTTADDPDYATVAIIR